MNHVKKDPHFLIIGPMLSPDGSNLGGATVSLNYLIEFIKKENVPHDLIDTQHIKFFWLKILNPFYVFLVFLLKIRKTDVVFVNVSQFGTKTISPFLYLMTRFFGKKFVFRPFGGAMQDHYEKYTSLQKNLFHRTLLQSDIFYLQTKELVNYFSQKAKNVLQLSTSRHSPPTKYLRPHRPYQKRFVFLGHVNESKGIDYLLEAVSALGSSFTVHIYGAIQDEKYHSIFQDSDIYQGVLGKDEVLGKLQEYDVLVLPTFYRGEGYPGAIVEAYSLGLPVITTDWRAIAEIVENGKTGLLIPPKSSEDLVDAMRIFNEKNYPAYSKNALSFFQQNFDADVVTGKVIQEIRELFQ